MMALKTTTFIALRLINFCHVRLEKLESLTDIVTAPRANPFAGIAVAVNLDDEAEIASDPVKVISHYSGSDVEDIDIEH